MTDGIQKPRPATESFSKFIAELDHGRTEEMLNEQLQAVVRSVIALGKPGKLTLALKLTTDGTFVTVTPTCKSEIPQPGVRTTHFYADPKKPGELFTDNPEQLTLNLTKLPPQQWAGRTDDEEN